MIGLDALGRSTVSGWDIALAGVVVIAAVLGARMARQATLRVVRRLEGLSGAAAGLGRVAYGFVLLIGIGIAFSVLGADVAPVQTAAIILAVVAVIALRGVAGQFAAGVVIQTRHPYRVGDHVETLGFVGIVRDINGLATVLETYENKVVHLPNAQVLEHPIVNRSASPGIRIDLEVRAARVQSLDEFQATVAGIVVRVQGVAVRPVPLVTARSADPERFTALVRFWFHASDDGPTVAGNVVAALDADLRDRGVEATIVTPPPIAPFTPSPKL